MPFFTICPPSSLIVSLCCAAHFHFLLPSWLWQGRQQEFPALLPSASKIHSTGQTHVRIAYDTHTLPLSFSGFLSSFIFLSWALSLFLPGLPSTPPLSHLLPLPRLFFFFSRSFSSLYHPLCHCGNFLPSWQACKPLSSPSLRLSLLSPFDTVNKQVEVAVIVDASAELPGNE